MYVSCPVHIPSVLQLVKCISLHGMYVSFPVCPTVSQMYISSRYVCVVPCSHPVCPTVSQMYISSRYVCVVPCSHPVCPTNSQIIIIIIAFKGAIQDFLQSPHCAKNCRQHVRSNGQGAIMCKSRATHRALIMCNMSCDVPLGTKGQLSY